MEKEKHQNRNCRNPESQLDLGVSVRCSDDGLTLSLSPSVVGQRFYGDIRDNHQCDSGARPVQAPSTLLSKDLAVDIPVDNWDPF